jgi:DNA-binding XRE family transcriptional regulator
MITPEQIKSARQLLGWSQMALTLESGLAQTTIGSIETGKEESLWSDFINYPERLRKSWRRFS